MYTVRIPLLAVFEGVNRDAAGKLREELNLDIKDDPKIMWIREHVVQKDRVLKAVQYEGKPKFDHDTVVLRAAQIRPAEFIGGIIEECHLKGTCEDARRWSDGTCPFGTAFLTFMNHALQTSPFECKFVIQTQGGAVRPSTPETVH